MSKFSIIDAIQETIPVTANSIIATAANEIASSLQQRLINIEEKEIAILPDGPGDYTVTDADETNLTLARITWQDSLAHFEVTISMTGITYDADAVSDPDDRDTQYIVIDEISSDLNEFRARIGMGI